MNMDTAVRPRITRRGLQLALAMLWLLDGALQLQPYMFGPGFRTDVIGGAAQGQPGWAAAGVHFTMGLLAAAPVLFNALFAVGQLALGVGLLWRRTARLALLGSVAWSLAVWYCGEALGGLASGSTDLLVGAPGAVLLYAVVAVLAWPRMSAYGVGEAPPAVGRWAWALLWAGGAALRAMPGQGSASALAGDISGSADGGPHWLASTTHAVGGWITQAGQPVVIGIVAAYAVIALAALTRQPAAVRASALAGAVLGVGMWVFGQALGELFTGQATDPNSGVLIVLLGVAVYGTTRAREIAPSAAPAPTRRRATGYPAPNTAG